MDVFFCKISLVTLGKYMKKKNCVKNIINLCMIGVLFEMVPTPARDKFLLSHTYKRLTLNLGKKNFRNSGNLTLTHLTSW